MPAAGGTLNASPALTDNYAGDGPPGANGLTTNGQARPLAVPSQRTFAAAGEFGVDCPECPACVLYGR